MSSSELRYLIAANTLAESGAAVKQKDIAARLGVSKVSAYNAVERLRDKGYIEKTERLVTLTEEGLRILGEYMTIIGFISTHLSVHCGTSPEQAYEDALNVSCAFSDATRNGVANFIRSGMGRGAS